ncbi:MAG: tetratricopeptide repeat protein, partial [Anaerolineales bacterium]|nr:tetratricopeptide repeat protein [Anaerolineales bacterium]
YLAEAQARLEQLLARLGEKTAVFGIAIPQAKALYSLGIVTHLQGGDAAATDLFMQSLAIWQRLGAAGELGAARAAHFIAFMALRRADYATAHIWYGQSNGRYRQLGDDWGLSEAQSQMGTLALREGNIVEARRLQEEALAIKQRLGDARGILFSVWALGNIARLQGDYPTARACYIQALQTAQQSDDKWSLPYCIEAFGYLALAERRFQQAARIFAAAEVLRTATGAPLPPVWHADYARARTEMETSLGTASFAAVWHEGQTMGLPQAIHHILQTSS